MSSKNAQSPHLAGQGDHKSECLPNTTLIITVDRLFTAYFCTDPGQLILFEVLGDCSDVNYDFRPEYDPGQFLAYSPRDLYVNGRRLTKLMPKIIEAAKELTGFQVNKGMITDAVFYRAMFQEWLRFCGGVL